MVYMPPVPTLVGVHHPVHTSRTHYRAGRTCGTRARHAGL